MLENLSGCRYQMTSYDAADRPDLHPAYGLHLHDPRFLEYVSLPAQPHTGLLVAPYDPRPGYLGGSSVAARRWPHYVEFTGVRTVCDVPESDVFQKSCVWR